MRTNTFIAQTIFSSRRFVAARRGLMTRVLQAELLGHQPRLSTRASAQMLSAAGALALSDDAEHRQAATDIIAQVSRLGHGAETVRAARFVSDRLGNFPVSDLMPSSDFRVPIALEVEAEMRRGANTVTPTASRLVLTDRQRELWEALHANRSISVTAPTSSGKSFVLLNYLVEQLAAHPTFAVAYVVPSRALIRQVSADLRGALTTAKTDPDGLSSVRVLSVPFVPEPKPSRLVYVVTQERLNLLLDAAGLHFDVLVVDEAQGLASGARGVLLEQAVNRVVTENPGVQTLFAAPSAANLQEVDRLFDVKKSVRIEESPVSLNRITLTPRRGATRIIRVGCVLPDGTSLQVGEVTTSEPFRGAGTLIQAARMFGAGSPSIVFASTASECETVAEALALPGTSTTPSKAGELAQFVRDHVHPDYRLADVLEGGVAFHYGNLPSIVRTAIEELFETGEVKYLACTSTLLQGVNLPARNIFMRRPMVGRTGLPVQGADLANLVGRAGRLRHDFDGRAFFVDPPEWPNESEIAQSAVAETVVPALTKILSASAERLAAAAASVDPNSALEPDIESALSRLVRDSMRGKLEKTLETHGVHLEQPQIETLSSAVQTLGARLETPLEVLERNPTVSPWRQELLLAELRGELRLRGADAVVPEHPFSERARESYEAFLQRLHTYLLPRSRELSYPRTGLALAWMRGAPLSALIGARVKRELTALEADAEESKRKAAISRGVRTTLKTIEQTVRFQYVRASQSYMDLLSIALLESGLERELIPVSLFLEVGACDPRSIALIGLGLSRTTARILTPAMPDESSDLESALGWLRRSRSRWSLLLPPLCIEEVNRLVGSQE